MKSLVILAAICCLSIANPIDNIDLDLEQKQLESYLTSMRDHMDLKSDPCDNFYQYACSKTSTGISMRRTFYSQLFDDRLLEQTIADMEPATHAEKVVKHFYNSCEQLENYTLMFDQLDSTKALGTFPVDREPTDKELMDLITDSVITGRFGIFMPVPITDTDAKDLALEPKNGIIIHVMRSFLRLSELRWQMIAFNVSENVKDSLTKTLDEFHTELEDAAKIREDKTVDIKNVEQLKEIAPDFDWDMFMETLKSKITVPTDMLENIKVHDPNLLKRVTKILKKTDKKILANFFIFKFMTMAYDMGCADLMVFFRPMIYKKLLEQYVNAADLAKHKVVLTDLKASLSVMRSALKNSTDEEGLNEILDETINLLANHSVILNEAYLDDYYKGYDLEKNMVFLNTFKLIKNMLEKMLKKIHNTEFVKDIDAHVVMGSFSDVYNLNTHNMSIVSYLISVTPHLWQKFFEENPQYEMNTAETCLKQQGMELDNYEMRTYLLSYAVNKVAYNDFMIKLSHIGGSEENEKLLEKLGFKDFRQVYFVGMAQDTCTFGEKVNGNLMMAFQHMEEFQEAFNCPANSEMNKIDKMKCDLENCDDIKEDSLHIVPYTNEKCIKPILLNTLLNF